VRQASSDGVRVLVVEDNATNVMLVRAILKTTGCRVDHVATAEEARAWLAVQRPDLILMDVRLPGLDGLSFTRELRARPSTRDIPIIAVTANAMSGDEDAAWRAGCDAYIAKPIGMRALIEKIEMVLGRRNVPTLP
jgi:CheY-like chemotaxis protein